MEKCNQSCSMIHAAQVNACLLNLKGEILYLAKIHFIIRIPISQRKFENLGGFHLLKTVK